MNEDATELKTMRERYTKLAAFMQSAAYLALSSDDQDRVRRCAMKTETWAGVLMLREAHRERDENEEREAAQSFHALPAGVLKGQAFPPSGQS